MLDVDAETSKHLLQLIQRERVYSPDAQVWGLLFRILRHSDLSIIDNDKTSALLKDAILVCCLPR